MSSLTFVSSDAGDDAADRTSSKEQTPKKNRIQLDFAPRSLERLNLLKAKTEASSYAEVVKNALRLYEALIEETENGKQFLVRDQEGVISRIRLFL